ncbi:HET-domain-containing protein [Lindgomyces ingoldianus]|uniref:HET-domain-containing protein n=1 Tax=Lindgomyces ingoldianus TaxID=673940 RepID=A0ACB6R978_9PLEO|nr:HET-domain-containing protein [Lindgomyces ingoldianus]KAF2475605.1 HET-domain-containing protein [Lindgomyces ingoldianus]
MGDRAYQLVPIDGEDARLHRSRSQRSQLQKYDSPDLETVKEYTYDPLPPSKKRIRLLRLWSGTIHGLEIVCELIEADYDNSFHIPTIPMDNYNRPKDETLEEECRRVRKNEIKYEALSWCWGDGPGEYVIRIERDGVTYKKRVRKELALALKYLRKPNERRTLWIDALCIDQRNHVERNQQVQMMSRIYTRAKEVCIWLGEDTDESKIAIDFIREEITQLKNFDTITSDKSHSEKWQALMMLMQRDWFSRRWVVQEIALAQRARIYCGPDSIPWKEFAVAVELFVEVETATHRLSEVMQKDEKFRHIPGWFEYVSELGASLLVQATGKVFRAQRTPMDDVHEDIEDHKKMAKFMEDVHTIDPLDRRSLLSLEYLVTTMFIFKASEYRDCVYSMLAIARDASPFAESTMRPDDVSILTMSTFDNFLAEKPFKVDYARPYVDVCRDFVEFCIQRKQKLDPVQALDILCRPWALDAPIGTSLRLPEISSINRKRMVPPPTTVWKKRLCDVECYEEKDQSGGVIKRIRYVKKDDDVWIDDKDDIFKAYKDLPKNDAIWDEKSKKEWKRPSSWEKVQCFLDHVKDTKRAHSQELPSWVTRASKAPFTLYEHPGMHILKTGRANADPLVGPPTDGHRNYSAAQTHPIDHKSLKFRKRSYMGHYSLYVAGVELDTVKEVRDASQGGNIPQQWLALGGWAAPYTNDPPAEFWRTLVADRGQDNKNPPYYYARACKESVHKGGTSSGRVNTTDLINNERNSIIAEFCRRVHAVIWGRSLFRTEGGKLGLATNVKPGDRICILYGCTVPVVLKRYKKKPGDKEREEFEDNFEAFRSCLKRLEKFRARKARYISNKGKILVDKETGKRTTWEEEVKKATKEENDRIELEKEIKETIKKLEAKAKKDKKGDSLAGKTRSLSPPQNPTLKRTKTTLRQNEERAKMEDPSLWYVFKGESYVHGLMDGEALREAFYNDRPKRIFELR